MDWFTFMIGYTLGHEFAEYMTKKLKECYNIPSTEDQNHQVSL